MAFEFLILGAGRGGTSLLAGLLDGHPGLEVGFECDAMAILMAHAAAERGPSPGRALRFRRRCDELGAASEVGRWGNKITTEQLRGLEDDGRDPGAVLEHFFDEVMAGIHVIFILRDGRTCVRSKMNRKGLDVAEAAERWRYSVRVHDALLGRANGSILRFEELLSDPEGVLTPVCEALGVGWDAAMLSGTESDKMRPEYRRTGLDARAAEVGEVPDGCLELIRDDLLRLGYARAR